MNRAILIGNLTKDPDLRSTASGLAVCTFSIGVSRRFTGQNGERETDFFNIVVWRKQAENAAKYLKKGSQVGITGSIQNRSYEANDGTKRYITEIIADEIQFLKSDSKPKTVDETMTEKTNMTEVEDDMPF